VQNVKEKLTNIFYICRCKYQQSGNLETLKNMEKLSDIELISEYKKSDDKDILGLLFKRYTKFVFLVSIKYMKNEDESRDIVMSVFEKLFTDLKRHEISNFKGWLHTVTRNHCLLKLRNNQTVLRNQDNFKKDELSIMEIETDSHLTNEKLKEKQLADLEKAVDELKPEQKICVDLFYLQEKTYTEVAEITGFSMNQVKSFIQNGKRNLKIKLTESGFLISLIFGFCFERIF
jgi:RNA polymerase sigma-70 factor (ECF subfamily)